MSETISTDPDAATSDEDDRVAIQLLPAEDGGYVLLTDNADGRKAYELTYDQGGHVINLLFGGLRQAGSTKGIE